MKHRRRLRKLVPDAELIRRRAAGEPLRELACDYDVAHTTLGRYFERPEVAKQQRQARRRRLRKLVPDAGLIRRRAAGEPLRELAPDYDDVAHTTLGRYFKRPEVAKQLRAEQRAAAARRSAERRLEQEVRRKARRRPRASASRRAAPALPRASALPADAVLAATTRPGSTSTMRASPSPGPICTARATRGPPASSPMVAGCRP
jgi:hypothetical protein